MPRRGVLTRKSIGGLIVVAVLSLGAGIAATATAHVGSSDPSRVQAPSHYSVSIQATYSGGNPSLVANFSPNGGLATPRWSVCQPPDTEQCTPVPSKSQFLTPGSTQAGTVFEAAATYHGKVFMARTTPWLGTVHVVGAPTLTGAARYGSIVAPRPGRWAGGWKTDQNPSPGSAGEGGGSSPNINQLNIEACQTRTAKHCVNLTPQGKTAMFGTGHPRIGQWFTGWYLFTFDQLEAGDTAYAGVGYGNAASIPIVKPGPAVAHSTAHGPITGPRPPTVNIRNDLAVRDGRIQIASVRCTFRCHVTVEALGHTGGSTGATTVVGDRPVSLAEGQLTRGPIKLTLYVGDGPALHRVSYLR